MSVLLVLAGLPVMLLLGAALVGVSTQLRFARADGTFRCRWRAQQGLEGTLHPRWCRPRARASWAHDVLLVQGGVFRPRFLAIAVHEPSDQIRAANRGEVGGLGAAPVVLSLRLDDGPSIEVAAPYSSRALLAGPFQTVALPSRPQTPPERPQHNR